MDRILFISHRSQIEGGASQSLLLLLKYLRSKYEVEVVCPRGEGSLPILLRKQNIQCFTLPNRTILYTPLLALLILFRNYVLVYGNNFSGRCRISLWSAKLTNRPFLWHIRESIDENSPYSNLYWIKFANAVIANSKDTAERLSKYLPKDKITTIPNGVEISNFNQNRLKSRSSLVNLLELPDDGLIILNIGRICFQKNQIDSLVALSQLKKEFKKPYLVFLGDFQEEKYVTQILSIAKDQGVTELIRLPGHIDNIESILCGADILLHTSRKESQGRVIIEAMASRLPVLAYNVGGVGEALKHGENGYLVDFQDYNGLNRYLKRLISRPLLRLRMGNSGYKRAKELFGIEQSINKVECVLKQFQK